MSTALFASYLLAHEDGRQTVLRDRWILIEDKRIAAVQAARPAAATVLDRPGRFVLPGLMNLHNHAYSEAIARSLTEDGHARKRHPSIVYTVLLPLSRRGIDILSPGERLAIARLGILQLLRGGATSVMDAFRNGIPEMFEAAAEMGIRFWGAPYVFSTADAALRADGTMRYAGDDGATDLAAWKALHARWEGAAEGRIHVVMAPHATDTCGPDLLREAAAEARRRGTLITTHMAQSKEEVATIAARHAGRTPAEYLDWLGLLAPDLLAAHCIDSTDADLRLMAARGATVLNCPRVFARSGTAAAFARFAAHGVRTVVATDGYNADMLGELHAASTISKIALGRADVATAPELLDAVTVTAAGAVGRAELGTIAPGATADLTVVDVTHPQLHPLADPRRGLIALANRADIADVFVDGEHLVAEGRCTRIDEAAITAAGSAAIARIWALPEAQAVFED
ncbi:MAG: amidohydrolase family protein [Rhodospirillales bacterium]|nr:amidohydrolase family protein [Rhodospirillales bacterium]